MKRIFAAIMALVIMVSVLMLVSCTSKSERTIQSIIERDYVVSMTPYATRTPDSLENKVGRTLDVKNSWYLNIYDGDVYIGTIQIIEFGNEQDCIDSYNACTESLYISPNPYQRYDDTLVYAFANEDCAEFNDVLSEVKDLYK